MTGLEKKLSDEIKLLKERIQFLESLLYAPKSEKFKLIDDSLQLKFSFESETKLPPLRKWSRKKQK